MRLSNPLTFWAEFRSEKHSILGSLTVHVCVSFFYQDAIAVVYNVHTRFWWCCAVVMMLMSWCCAVVMMVCSCHDAVLLSWWWCCCHDAVLLSWCCTFVMMLCCCHDAVLLSWCCACCYAAKVRQSLSWHSSLKVSQRKSHKKNFRHKSAPPPSYLYISQHLKLKDVTTRVRFLFKLRKLAEFFKKISPITFLLNVSVSCIMSPV